MKEEDTISEHAPTTVSSETLLKSQTLPVTSKIPTSSSEITNSDTSLQKNQTISKQECAATSCTVDSFSVEPTPPVDVVDSKIISTNVVSGKNNFKNSVTLGETKKCALFSMSVLNEEGKNDCTLRRQRKVLQSSSAAMTTRTDTDLYKAILYSNIDELISTAVNVNYNEKSYEIKHKCDSFESKPTLAIKKNSIFKMYDEVNKFKNEERLGPVPVPRNRRNSCPTTSFIHGGKNIVPLETESSDGEPENQKNVKQNEQKLIKEELSSEENETVGNDLSKIIKQPELPNNTKPISERVIPHDKFFNEICNFRFKVRNVGTLRDKYNMSNSYVQRRRSEIEARIRSDLEERDVIFTHRKYSEGSLTPSNSLYLKDNRHVIFDSKNLHKEKKVCKMNRSDINLYSQVDNYQSQDFNNFLVSPKNKSSGKNSSLIIKNNDDNNFLDHLNILLANKLDDYV